MTGHSTHPGVVVGVDGSPSSTMAVRWAAREATILSKEAHMMVVGCHGHDALQRTSVSMGLVHHAHCPVAVIHDEAPTLLGPSRGVTLETLGH